VFRLLILITTLVPSLAQEPHARIRVEVRTGSGPVAGAIVTLSGISIETDRSGIASASLPVGKLDVSMTKDGFLPAKASLPIDDPREWQIAFDLQPQPQREEEIMVFATRTDTRIQDLPTRVQVLGREETFLSPRLAALFRWNGWTSRVSAGDGFFAPHTRD